MSVLEDFGEGTPISVYRSTDLCDIVTADDAKVVSTFVDTDYLNPPPRRRVLAAYLYENKLGKRFIVYAFRAQS